MQDSKALAMLNLVDFRYKAESAEKVVTDTPSKSVIEVDYCGKQWFMQSFEYQMIDLILKKIYKLRGKIWKKMQVKR